MAPTIKSNRWLFTIDLDGTLLQDSSKGVVSAEDQKAVRRAIEEGHVVCIVTGRPWRSTKKVYEALGLDTVVGNYNGAQIHNPTDYNFIPHIAYMNLNDVMYILGDKKIKESMSNLAIEGPGWVMLEHRDEDLERVFGFKDSENLKLGIDYHRLPLRPTGVIFDTKPGIDIIGLKDYLQRTYGDLCEFSSWGKGEGLTPVFDMTEVGVTKAKAISLMARYYDIPMKQTVAMGDGYNDIPMFDVAEISVAMANASDDIKEKATFVTTKSHKNGGVAEFINAFLDKEKSPTFIKELKTLRKRRKNIRMEIVKAH